MQSIANTTSSSETSLSETSATATLYCRLPAILDISTCHTLLMSLREALAARKHIHLDASSIERIQTPGLQLILSAAKSAYDQKLMLRLSPISPALRAAIDDAGLSSQISRLTYMEH